jgi:Reverse transcriptase (RNA-dependent DNA polymerase)
MILRHSIKGSFLPVLMGVGTWCYRPLPPDRTALPCKGVFKRKLRADGTIERCKARLVLEGFRQRYGIVYDAVFASVVRASTVRLFFNVVASKNLKCHQVDMKNAFIQSSFADEIYTQQPPGYNDGSGRVLLLLKSLYGLKQAPRVWHQKLIAFLFDVGCVLSLSDSAYCSYSDGGGSTIYILLEVDDTQIAAEQLSRVLHCKKLLLGKFLGQDLAETQF